MTAAALSALIGKERGWRSGNGLTFRVKVLDAKVAWGNTLVLVTPVAGENEAWVREDGLTA